MCTKDNSEIKNKSWRKCRWLWLAVSWLRIGVRNPTGFTSLHWRQTLEFYLWVVEVVRLISHSDQAGLFLCEKMLDPVTFCNPLVFQGEVFGTDFSAVSSGWSLIRTSGLMRMEMIFWVIVEIRISLIGAALKLFTQEAWEKKDRDAFMTSSWF